MYDPRVNKWREVAPMGGPRAYGTAATINGAVYATGGMRTSVSAQAAGEVPRTCFRGHLENCCPAGCKAQSLTCSPHLPSDCPAEGTAVCVAVAEPAALFGGHPPAAKPGKSLPCTTGHLHAASVIAAGKQGG